MHVVVCPDKFRGSLSSVEAAHCIGSGLQDAGVADVVEIPMADGGEGTLDAVVAAMRGDLRSVDTVDALGRPVVAAWGILPDGTAVVEAATSVGLAVLDGARDAVEASSAGLGVVIGNALDEGARRLIVTVGGVATTDGGSGCLDEIGWDLRGVPTEVATDVSTRFVDAARVFGPQKGADAGQVELLTLRLGRLAVLYASKGRDIADLPGSGAAGGIAGGLAAVGATLRPGFDLVAGLVGLPAKVASAGAVVTGEGRLDATSFEGKVVGGVVALARGKRCVVLVGDADEHAARQLVDEGVDVRTVRSAARDDAHSFDAVRELLRALAREEGARLGGA